MEFTTWLGPGGAEEYILEHTGCKAFTSEGINIRKDKKTAILRSVDGTEYYDDDLSDPNNVKYTLFGHNGDQDEAEKRHNEPLLNREKTENIYLYRVKKKGKKTIWVWYGQYVIKDKVTKRHPGKDGIERNIVVLSLVKL